MLLEKAAWALKWGIRTLIVGCSGSFARTQMDPEQASVGLVAPEGGISCGEAAFWNPVMEDGQMLKSQA